ncbi:hypothetical protein AZ78_1972 [Lysobacter capsici AZ78]|uniref:Uncharacterized protein n=1 Tax=Lysobacter capsici AZ78 TaxID=1444315 RepID=A0A108U8C3_9GAMM|nr:hypothetical protein AZ78_1972 [Lysobacter capsici AZ78]
MAAIARPCQLGTRMRPIDRLGRRGQVHGFDVLKQIESEPCDLPASSKKPGNSPTTAPNAARKRLKPGDSRRDFAARFGQVGPASPRAERDSGKAGTARPARSRPGHVHRRSAIIAG